MKCIEIQSRISDWVDGGPAEGEIESHLKVCRDCASFQDDVLALKQSSNALGLVDPPSRLWESLQVQLVSEGLIKTQEAKQSFWQRLFPPVLMPSLNPHSPVLYWPSFFQRQFSTFTRSVVDRR